MHQSTEKAQASQSARQPLLLSDRPYALIPQQAAKGQSEPATGEEAASPTSPAYLKPQQVAELLQVPLSWVYEQTRKRAGIRNPDLFPFKHFGRYLRFKREAVLAWAERQNGHEEKRRRKGNPD